MIELADVLRKPLQARAALERAFAVAESKGNVVFARQASERLATPRSGGAV